MAGFDRSKFKGSKIASVQDAQSEAKKNEQYFGDGGGRMKYHKIEDGKNTFRIAPPHVPGNSAYEPIYTAQLDCQVDEYKEGEKTGVKIVKKKKIFIATQHGPKDDKGNPILTKDPVLTYIDFLYKQAEELYSGDKDTKRTYLNQVTGFMSGGKWTFGIKPNMEYGSYAWDSKGEFGQLNLYSKWMKDMEKISLEANEGNVLSLDMFSDPDTGFPLVISKDKEIDKAGKSKNVTSISVEQNKPGVSWDDFFDRVKVSDSQLQQLEKVDSLKERFSGVYSQRDFDLALDGLKRFDDAHGYNIFENEEFLDVIEEISKLVPEDKKKEENEVKEGKDIEKTFEKPLPKKTETEASTTTKQVVPPIKMKSFLKGYIEENYGSDYELPQLTSTELKKWYQLGLDGEELPFPEEQEEQESQEQEEQEEEQQEELNDTSADVNLDASADLQKQLQAIKDRKAKQGK